MLELIERISGIIDRGDVLGASLVARQMASLSLLENKDSDGRTPLMRACFNCNATITEMLVELGACANTTDNDGWTPLMYAARDGDVGIAQMMIANGADINIRDHSGGWTALMKASYNGHEEIVRMLLNASVDIDTQNGMGQTALMFSVSSRDARLVELLIQHGANLALRCSNGYTALQRAKDGGHEEAVRILQKAMGIT